MNEMDGHERFMRAAIEQARKGLGRTHPNPCVGSVIVRGDEIVARGFHARAGGPHAEVNAIADLPEEVDPADCTIYVTLEPCCIHGRTPPCTSAILTKGLPRVVIGSLDPNPRVDGKGVALLREAGVEVTTGVLRGECDELIRPFSKRVLTGLPWVTAKWAMSLDGKIATREYESSWITGPEARERVHYLRDTHDAIMVGKNTLTHDNPRLTCRLPDDQGRDPWRVVVDARLEASLDSHVYNLDDTAAPTIVLTGEGADARRRQLLEERGVEVVVIARDERGWLDMEAGLRALAERGLTSVLVEGGGNLLGSLLDGGHIDRVYAFIAPKLIGGQGAISPVLGKGIASMSEVFALQDWSMEQVGGDVLLRGDLTVGMPGRESV
jgi:diaminohydroxyphosphoribosylaminopyrimidine deaminase/5-amino-6-(5-phosphoribosylamino)uracil reductase